MREYVLKKAAAFRGINDLTMKGEIVIFGSTSMADFPFYDLINKSRLENAVYNRSISGLTIEEALEVLPDCVLAIKPKKVFLSLGEEDTLNAASMEQYAQLVRTIRTALPSTKLYLICLPEKNEKTAVFNDNLTKLCDNRNIFPIRFSAQNYRQQFLELSCFFRNNPITFTEAFAVAAI